MLIHAPGWPLQALLGGSNGFLATYHQLFDGRRGDFRLQLPDRCLTAFGAGKPFRPAPYHDRHERVWSAEKAGFGRFEIPQTFVVKARSSKPQGQ